ncbi:MAG TPA: hypothetical protein VGL70_19790 [Candidatus Binatia bacterium]|jgi:hypothetical protein
MAKSLIIALMRVWFLSLCALAGGPAICARDVPAANPPETGKPGAPPMTYPLLVERLRAAGAAVEPAGGVDQPFFSGAGKAIRIGGEDVQVFQYPTAAAAEAEARRVSRDGSAIGTAKPHWIGTPHFYRQGRLLVLYLGEEKKVLQVLEAVLGRQFAGQ